jgi:hypothetical protein
LWLDKVDELSSKGYADTIVKRLKDDVPAGICKSILVDNGGEHARGFLPIIADSLLGLLLHDTLCSGKSSS